MENYAFASVIKRELSDSTSDSTFVRAGEFGNLSAFFIELIRGHGCDPTRSLCHWIGINVYLKKNYLQLGLELGLGVRLGLGLGLGVRLGLGFQR